MAEQTIDRSTGGAPAPDAVSAPDAPHAISAADLPPLPPDAAEPGSDASAADSAVTLDLDARGGDDLEAAMRDAVAAVEEVEAGSREPDDQEEQEDSAQVAELRREIEDLRDRSMRTLADFDNYRKRTERERQETRRYALLEPLRDFLPIADNLERALSAGGAADDLKRGVELILRQMQELLRRFGVREVAAAGESFNPAVHEAVVREESGAVTAPTIGETLVKGYLLHDRLLRPAMVKVLVPPETRHDEAS